MPIKTLVHNLKLLGFDENNHAKGSIEVNELLFSRGAVNNDKALEYICLFLFRRLDRNRVKRELASLLAIHTYASKQNFIARVYKWLLEIRKKTHLLDNLPLRKSELLAYHGGNLIKIMAAFSTYVLESTTKNKDAARISKLPLVAIQNSIVEANQTFSLSTETTNTYISNAAEAANDISAELSFSPPSPSSQDIILVKSDRIEQLNDYLDSLVQDPPPVSHEPTATEESSSSVYYEQSTIIGESSNLTSYEQPRTVEESSNLTSYELPRPFEDSSTSVSNTSLFSTAAPSSVVGERLYYSAITRSSSYELDSAAPKVPEIKSSNAKGPVANVYLQEGSRIIRTPNWIPRPLTPDQQLDSPEIPARPIPRTMPNTNMSATLSSVVLPPMQFNYMTEPNQLPPLRDIILENSFHLPAGTQYLVLPPRPLEADYSPDMHATYVPESPPLPNKRKHDQVETEENEDNVVVPSSPPSRKRRISYGAQDQGTLTPTIFYEMDMVPPLMDEAAPFRRIYQTEYFDIDFMTPDR
ncbi:hypothetical protein PS15p_205967 [Mucor circinelloides]